VQRRHELCQQGHGMDRNGTCRKPVAEHEHEVMLAGMGRQRRPAVGRQPAAKIGAHEKLRPVLRGARDHQYGKAERAEVVAQPRVIERRMYGVAGAGMRQLEIEQRLGGERGAAARQPDAGGGEGAQLLPRIDCNGNCRFFVAHDGRTGLFSRTGRSSANKTAGYR
jgi:hypothetical protein